MSDVFVWLLAVLIAASLAGYLLHRRGPSSAIDNLNARIRAWWVMIAVGGVVLLAGRYAVIALFAALSWAAMGEFISPLRWRAAGWACWAAWILQYAALAAEWRWGIWLAVPLLAAATGDRRRAGGLLLCVFALAHAPAMLLFGTTSLVFFFVLIVQSSDVIQYLGGKLFGRHTIAPRVSPGKTVEGLLAGLVCAPILGALLAHLTPFAPSTAAGLGLLLAVAGFFSALVFSALKRSRGVKDWGQSISGHGGVLDRVDSLCLSAPVAYYAARWLM